MAIKAGSVVTYDTKGIREELSNVISMISPTETPLLTSAGKGEGISNTFFEWQTDALEAANTGNAQKEGEDYDSVGLQATIPTVRLGNYCQISSKSAVVSGTVEKTSRAGRGKELPFIMAKRAKELKRDQEAILLSNQGANAGNSTTARTTGSLLAFIKTNVSMGATGINPVYTNIPTGTRTNGTPRAFTEALLKSVMEMCYTAGGNPDEILMGPKQKQVFSTFAGIAAQRYNAEGSKPTTIIGAADVYLGDFGTLGVVVDRFCRSIDAFLLNSELYDVRFLRDYTQSELAKTGDAEKRLLLVEYGLCVKNEAGLGLITDLS